MLYQEQSIIKAQTKRNPICSTVGQATGVVGSGLCLIGVIGPGLCLTGTIGPGLCLIGAIGPGLLNLVEVVFIFLVLK